MVMKLFIQVVFSLKEDRRTRGHKVMLVKEHHRFGIRKYSFSQRTINELNKLFKYYVNATSLNMLG